MTPRSSPAWTSPPSGTGDLRTGDTVYAIGNPLGLGLAVSAGVISALERQVDRYELPCVMSTADISEGSSGGALLNVYGQAVAVTTGAYVYGNSMYLAVPIDPGALRRPDRRGPVPLRRVGGPPRRGMTVSFA